MSIDAESGILYAESAHLEDNGDVFTVMEIIYAPPTVSGHYRVPRSYDNVIIHNSAFRNCIELTEITLPENVVHIGDGAFHSCKSLKKVNLPADMTAVFSRLPEHYSSEYLGYEAFARSGITSVRIPYGVTHIIDYCFYGCSALSEVYMPDTVKTVEGSSFEECSALKNIFRTDKTGAVIPRVDDGVHPEQ